MQTRRAFLRLAATSALGAAGLAACSPGGRRAGGPNVIIVLADQLRRDVLGFAGGRNIETPAIDRLAREGAVFDRALSTCPVCTPYRGMLMTGRLPTFSGIVANRVEASPIQNPDCLAQLFARDGYETAYLGKWHLSAGAAKHSGLTQLRKAARAAYLERNPEPEFTPPGAARLGFSYWRAYNYHADFNDYWYYADEPVREQTGRFETDVQFDQAIDFVRDRAINGRSFFLMISPHPPHPPFDRHHLPPGGFLLDVPNELHWRRNVPSSALPRVSMPFRLYLAMVLNLDHNVGRLLDVLDQTGIEEDTVVVFTSDHGEMMGSHSMGKKMLPYAEAVDVPLIYRWPGTIPAGRRTPALQTPIDHLTTLCGLTGLEAPSSAQGIDFSDWLLGGSAPSERDALLMMNFVASTAFFTTLKPRPEWRAVRTQRHTYARWIDGSERIYDNDEDPYQMRDLAASSPELRLELRERLRVLLAEAHDEFQPGPAYADWYDDERNLVRTALGPVSSSDPADPC